METNAMETNAIAGVNLNDPWVLDVYTRLINFKSDSSQILCTFQELSPTQQRSLQSIAHYLGLEYEYTRVDRIARIGRATVSIGLQGHLPDSSTSLASQLATYHTPSRASSTSSLHSGHGRGRFRKMFSRRSSLHSRPSFQSQTSLQSKASSGYEEIVFVETSSGRHPSISSGTRQRASMDNVQKAAMLAVKKIGACWRCKILRKTCDPDSPCQNCPKSKKQSFWHSVGCKRGTIVDKVARTLLCPNADKPARRPSSPERRREAKEVKRKNKEVRRVTEERNIQVNGEDTRGIFHNWLLEQARHPDQIQVEDALTSDMTQLQPLVQCTLAIEWEIKEIGSGDGPHISIWRQFIHEMYPWYPKFGLLLHSAATYQAFTQQNQLIAQSLICIRSSLEVFRAQHCSSSTSDPHARCSLSSGCRIESITELDASLTTYLKELGRVIFKKENMRGHGCWLSLFYSLCLQGYVRRLLCRISMDDTRSFPNEYLRLVIHLFSARFGSYDPLATILSNTYSGDSTKLDGSYWAAQLTTNRSSWETRSISNPCEYLRGLYGDTELGSDIEMSQKTEENKLIESTQDIIALPDSVGSVADVDLTDTTVFDDQFIWSGEDLVNSFQDASFYENDWECLLDTFDFNPADRDPCNDLVPNLPSEADMHPADQSFKPYECKSLSPEDLFNPRWVRAHGIAQQGWCGLCNPGRWLLLGDSSYIDDKAFNHGINSITGRHFDEPKSTRQSSCDTWEAFCGTCLQWVSLYWDKDNSYFWFEHANKCHINSSTR